MKDIIVATIYAILFMIIMMVVPLIVYEILTYYNIGY